MRIGRSLGMLAVATAVACSQPSKTVEPAPEARESSAARPLPDFIYRPPRPQPHDFPALEPFASALALYRAPFPEHARVLSVRAAPDQTHACGWIQVTPEIAAPFVVSLSGPFPQQGVVAIAHAPRHDLLRNERSEPYERLMEEQCRRAGSPLGPLPRLNEAGV